MQSQPIIEVKNLVGGYGAKEILHNLQFQVAAGEIFMIVGGSGSGKTTLLNHLIGLCEPFSGEIIIDGNNLFAAGEAEQLKILQKIGVLYQQNALFGSMNLLENVRLPLEELTYLPAEAMEQIAQNKLNMVELGEFCHYKPNELSGGMQKRAALARAMALDPKILFLDEPSSGLDPITAAELDRLISDLAKTLGITFVIISHDLLSINRIAERIILLHAGKILAEGKPQELVSHENPLVREFFNPE